MSSSKGQIRLRLDHKALKRTARRYKQKVASGVLILQGAQGELSAIPRKSGGFASTATSGRRRSPAVFITGRGARSARCKRPELRLLSTQS